MTYPPGLVSRRDEGGSHLAAVHRELAVVLLVTQQRRHQLQLTVHDILESQEPVRCTYKMICVALVGQKIYLSPRSATRRRQSTSLSKGHAAT